MSTADCYEFEQLEAHLEGRADAPAAEALELHLQDCERCRARLREVQANLGILPRAREAMTASAPERVGPYRILRELGRGSMGVVYLAEQEHPRRRIALKLPAPGLVSAASARRMRYEANVLAQLRHPGIAQIYEAGEWPQPYFAMEYVEGERLDRYADAQKLDVAGRLALLARICDAVEHAHRQGIVHRDLKPGNILVDAEGAPKVLDFGVARSLEDDLQSLSMHTEIGQLVGTLPFMSPEQVTGDASQIDARTDVYALGVLGYVLLAARLPYALEGHSLPESARIIRDQEAQPIRRFLPRLDRDVETILRKALEKERERRYPSAAALASDLRRYLERQPIQARDPSSWYQARRFAQRNRGLSFALLALLFVLAAAVATSTTLAVRARAAEREARAQSARSEAVNEFLREMLAAPSPDAHPGQRDTTVREVLGTAANQLDGGSLSAQPEVELGVRLALGDSYRALGEYAAAQPQFERALELARAQHAHAHPDLALALNKLARVVQSRGDAERAEALQRECLQLRRELYGETHVEIATSLNNLADLRRERGDAPEALRLHEEALAMRRRLLGPQHQDIANSLNNLAALRYGMGEHEAAAELFRQSLEMDVALRGELHPDVVVTATNLATVLSGLGRTAEAEELFERVLELNRELHGAEHPNIATALNNLALHHARAERPQEAERLFRESLALDRRLRGPRHPRVANTLANLAGVLQRQERLEDAEAAYLEAESIFEESFGADDGRAQAVMARLVALYEAWPRAQEARRWSARILERTP